MEAGNMPENRVVKDILLNITNVAKRHDY